MSLGSYPPGARALSWKQCRCSACEGSPIIVLRDGASYLAVGAPGGRRIVNAVTQTLLNIVEHDMGPPQAVSAPRIDASGPTVLANSRLGDNTIERLRAIGHRIRMRDEG